MVVKEPEFWGAWVRKHFMDDEGLRYYLGKHAHPLDWWNSFALQQRSVLEKFLLPEEIKEVDRRWAMVDALESAWRAALDQGQYCGLDAFASVVQLDASRKAVDSNPFLGEFTPSPGQRAKSRVESALRDVVSDAKHWAIDSLVRDAIKREFVDYRLRD